MDNKTCLEKCFRKIHFLYDDIENYIYMKKININTEICGICLEYIKKDYKIMKCKHIFHKNCIYEWKCIKNSCPLCRKEIYNIIDNIEEYTYNIEDIIQEETEESIECLSECIVNTFIQLMVYLLIFLYIILFTILYTGEFPY